MLAPIFMVILTVIHEKYLKGEISLKVWKKNTALIFELIVTVVA